MDVDGDASGGEKDWVGMRRCCCYGIGRENGVLGAAVRLCYYLSMEACCDTVRTWAVDTREGKGGKRRHGPRDRRGTA